jgi:hypothetical protein
MNWTISWARFDAPPKAASGSPLNPVFVLFQTLEPAAVEWGAEGWSMSVMAIYRQLRRLLAAWITSQVGR